MITEFEIGEPKPQTKLLRGQDIIVGGVLITTDVIDELLVAIGDYEYVDIPVNKIGKNGGFGVSLHIPEDYPQGRYGKIRARAKINGQYIYTSLPVIIEHENESVVFCVVGDTDITSHTKDVFNQIVKQKPMFWGLLGDITYSMGIDSDIANEYWFREYMPQQLKDIPILSVLGNHDRINREQFARMFNLQSFGTIADKWFYSYVKNHVAIIVLNSELDSLNEVDTPSTYKGEKPFPIDNGEQITFIKNQLTKYQNDANIAWIFIFVHKTAYSYCAPASVYNSMKIAKIHTFLDNANKCKGVFTGHQHRIERSHLLSWSGDRTKPIINNKNNKGQYYYVIGAGGSKRLGNFPIPCASASITAYKKQSVYSFLKITADWNQFTTEFIDINGKILDTFIITR